MPHVAAQATNSLQNDESPTSFVPSCTTSTSETLCVIWPTLCNLPPPERRARSGLRSLSETDSYTTPRLRTKFGERAFSISSPASWNSLSLLNYAPFLTQAFYRTSYLFKLAFTIQLTIDVCLCIPDVSVSFLLTFINFYCSAHVITLVCNRRNANVVWWW